jgi:hypothetical protein
MIELGNVENHVSFRCEVVGYEFPDSLEDNWCLLKVTVKQDARCFEAIDPALETYDLIAIQNWFKSLSEGKLPRYAHLAFTEPCISFEFLACKDSRVRLGINLHNELTPDFKLKQFNARHSNWAIVFELDNDDFKKTLDGIRTAIDTYPVRGNKTIQQ